VALVTGGGGFRLIGLTEHLQATVWGSTKAWILISRPSLLCLFLGLIWVIFSYTFDFKFASSGAILCCAGIISEILFSHSSWRAVLRQHRNGQLVVAVQQDHEAKQTYTFTQFNKVIDTGTEITLNNNEPYSANAISDPSCVNHFKLLSVTKKSEITAFVAPRKSTDLPHNFVDIWDIQKTVNRIDNKFKIANSTFILIGTVIWAYGPTSFCTY